MSIKDDLTGRIHLVLGSMHLRADRGWWHMIMVTHLHMMILLERLEMLSGLYLVRKALLISRKRQLHVYQLLLLLEAERVHCCLLGRLAEA